MTSVLNISNTTRSDEWKWKESKKLDKLWKALVESVLFYGVEVWRSRYLDETDKIQTSYYKKVLKLPKYCSSYTVRYGVQKYPTSCEAIERSLNWLHKITCVDEARFPKIYLRRLKTLARQPKKTGDITYNWALHLEEALKNNPIINFDNQTTVDFERKR